MPGPRYVMMYAVATVGERAIGGWRFLSYTIAVLWAVVVLALRPRCWGRVVRREFVEQCYQAGNQALWFVALLAALVGLGLVFQAIVWLNLAGQSELLGRFLVLILVREIAPLLVNLIVIGRSGTAMTAELGTMEAVGQVRVLDAQGLDPFVYLVVPRVTAIAVAVFCLTLAFLIVSLGTGYCFGRITAIAHLPPGAFLNTVLAAMGPGEAVALPLKTLLPGMVTGVICCVEGLEPKASVTDMPRALPRCFAYSVTALFMISGSVSLFLFVL